MQTGFDDGYWLLKPEFFQVTINIQACLSFQVNVVGQQHYV